MILNRLTMINFMRFAGRHVINFDGKSIVGIIAEWENEPGRSNQSGKSGIIDAISYLFWGKTRAKSDQFLLCNHTPNSDYEISGLITRSDGKEISIRRGREGKSPLLEIDIDGTSGGDNQTIIDAIGMTYEEFIFGPCFLQGQTNLFMDASPSVKAERILRYLQSYRWSEPHEVAKENLADCRDNMTKLRGSLEALSDHQSVDDAKNNRDVALKLLDKSQANLKRLRKRRKKLKKTEEKVKLRAGLIAKLEELESSQATVQSRIAKLNRKSKDKKIAEAELLKLRDSIGNVGNELKRLSKERDSTDSKIVDIRAKLDVSSSKLDIIQEFSGVCPVLNEPCDRVEQDEDEEQQIRDELCRLNLSLKKLKKKKKSTISESNEIGAAGRRISSLKSEIKSTDISMLDEYIEQLEGILSNRAAVAKKIGRLVISQDELDELEEIDDEIADAEDAKDEATKSFGRADALVQQAKLAAKRLKKCKKDIDRQESDLMMWNYIERMYSRSGIPSHELEQAFSMLEDEINYVLAELKARTTATMSSFRELKKWEDNCVGCGAVWKDKSPRKTRCTVCGTARAKKRREEFTLTFHDDKANEDRFDMDSGGGKILKSIGVRIALSLMKMRHTKDPLSLLVLDECFGELDHVNQESVLQVITSVATRLGFEQVIIITHTSIKDSFPNTLLVTRKEYYSEISWR